MAATVAVVGPLDAHHRMHDGAHLQAVHVHLGGHGVDQEGRVLDGDLHDRPGRVPAVPLEIGVVRAHRELPGRSLGHEREQLADVRGQLVDAELGDEHRRHAAGVCAHELGKQPDPARAQLFEQRIDESGVARVGLGHGGRLRLAAHEP